MRPKTLAWGFGFGPLRGSATLAILFVSAGCGAEDDEGAQSSDATVDAAWAGYCVATFTQDYPVLDAFDEPVFTAAAGDQYLLSSYGDTFQPGEAELIADLPAGPYDFAVSAPAGAESLPFTTDCVQGAEQYYAVFTDVAVYAEAELTTPLCSLTRGTALPRGGTSTGFAIAGDFTFSGPATYQVFLGPFGAQCGNVQNGYVSVPHTEVYGTGTWLVPFATLLRAPAAGP